MKLPIKCFFIGMALLGMSAGNAGAILLNFDSLPAGGPLSFYPPVVPDGYSQLSWNNFAVANGSEFAPNTGYYTGLVSGNNEIFNEFGNPASVSIANGLFDLYSAYLTAALNLNTPLNIQVEGFDGTILLYDNTYTVNNLGPTLINFDYTGVSQVTFISSPGQQFVMDNMTVNVPDESNTLGLFGATMGGLMVLRWKTQKRTA
jgi:hypothetical protein